MKKRGEKSPSEIVSMESVININSSMNPAALCYFHLNEVARTLLRDVGVLQYDLDMNCLGMFLYVNIASHFGINMLNVALTCIECQKLLLLCDH